MLNKFKLLLISFNELNIFLVQKQLSEHIQEEKEESVGGFANSSFCRKKASET